jgi:RNA polymerase sigma-70 factor (ECF subfamily)
MYDEQRGSDIRTQAASGETDINAGDVASEVDSLYSQFWRDVYGYAFMLVRHREDAEDVASETFLRAYASWLRASKPEGPALPWLLLIARRIVIDRARRRRLIAWLPLGPRHDVEQDVLKNTELWLWFDRVSQLLTPRQREALVLRYQFDLPDPVIARVMGLSSAGVRTLVSRALSALRQHPELLQ